MCEHYWQKQIKVLKFISVEFGGEWQNEVAKSKNNVGNHGSYAFYACSFGVYRQRSSVCRSGFNSALFKLNNTVNHNHNNDHHNHNHNDFGGYHNYNQEAFYNKKEGDNHQKENDHNR